MTKRKMKKKLSRFIKYIRKVDESLEFKADLSIEAEIQTNYKRIMQGIK